MRWRIAWLALAILLAVGGAFPAGRPAVQAQSENVVLTVELPHDGDAIVNTATISGWAVDQTVADSPGIVKVAIFLDGNAETGQYLGDAQIGIDRPDVAEALGNPAYAAAGWAYDLTGSALTGQHAFVVVAYAGSGLVGWVTLGTITLVPPAPEGTEPPASEPAAPPAPPAPPPAPGTPAAPPAPPPPPTAPTPPNTGGPLPPAPPPPPSAPSTGGPLPPAPPAPPSTTPSTGGPLPPAPPPPPSAPTAPTITPITILSPTEGQTVGATFEIRAATTYQPAGGRLRLRITSAAGIPLASVNLAVQNIAGGTGAALTTSVTLPASFRGGARVELADVDPITGAAIQSAAVNINVQ